jgi:two-component system, OmpR family, sensor histidine kinase KdpD
VRARVSGGRILMRVVDRGPGIPLGEQERIFTPFYRAPGALGQGSGLGLAIVRGLVEANGGHIRVESLPGQGSSFVVDLPLPQAPPVVEVDRDGRPRGAAVTGDREGAHVTGDREGRP